MTVFLALLAALPWGARASSLAFGPFDLRSVFHVAKSENQNQVHYALRLDASCRPSSTTPVFAYWRRLRHGERFDEPLEGPGVRLYGASSEQKVQQRATGGRVDMYVRALRRLPIVILVVKNAHGCEATAHVTLRGESVHLSYAFVQLRSLGLGVKYVEVVGRRERDGSYIRERFN